MTTGTSLAELFTVVNHCILQLDIRPLNGSRSLSRRAEFNMSLCFVAKGIRAAYLIDSFTPPCGEHDLQRLLKLLREATSIFNDVCLVCDCNADQFIFINTPICRARISTLVNSWSSGWTESRASPLFVSLAVKPSLVEAPIGVISALKHIAHSTADLISLPSDITTETLVPLAGFLLEYPTVYVPHATGDSGFLNNELLDVYECVLLADPRDLSKNTDYPSRYSILKFSCPKFTSDSHTFSRPTSVMDEIRTLFRSRLHQAGCSWDIDVEHTTFIGDRVAL